MLAIDILNKVFEIGLMFIRYYM